MIYKDGKKDMGFLDWLKSIFGAGQNANQADHWIQVRCQRCGEVIKTRVDLQSALNPHDDGGYLMRKTLVGNQLCFQRIEVTLIFDENRNLIDHEIQHGQLITANGANDGN